MCGCGTNMARGRARVSICEMLSNGTGCGSEVGIAAVALDLSVRLDLYSL